MRARLFAFAVVAVALALGIALGAGPLQHDSAERARDSEAAGARLATARRDVRQLGAQTRSDNAYADATASATVRGTLAGHDVALVALPGADAATLTALRSLLAAAGAAISADLTLGAPLSTTSSRSLVEALTSQMVTEAKLAVPPAADGYQRFGLLLARAIGVPTSAHTATATYDAPALAIISGFQTARLVTAAKVTARSSLVLFVTGPAASSSGAAARNAVPVEYLRSLAGQVSAVVAGPSSAASGLGIVGSLRSGSPGLSTVDGLELTRGRVAAVLALSALARGVTGDFGSIGQVDGPVPAS